MPGAPTQATLDEIEPHAITAGVPIELFPLLFQALDAAGYTVVTKDAGDPVTVADTAQAEVVQVLGRPGCFIVGVQMGIRGWWTWMEMAGQDGGIERTAPVFLDGDGALLLAE